MKSSWLLVLLACSALAIVEGSDREGLLESADDDAIDLAAFTNWQSVIDEDKRNLGSAMRLRVNKKNMGSAMKMRLNSKRNMGSAMRMRLNSKRNMGSAMRMRLNSKRNMGSAMRMRLNSKRNLGSAMRLRYRRHIGMPWRWPQVPSRMLKRVFIPHSQAPFWPDEDGDEDVDDQLKVVADSLKRQILKRYLGSAMRFRSLAGNGSLMGGKRGFDHLFDI